MDDARLTVAAVQPPYPEGDSWAAHAATRRRGLDLLRAATERNCDLICLPECFNCVGLTPGAAQDAARNAGALREEVAEVARQGGCYVLLPLVEERDGVFRNACDLLGPDGRTLFSYLKTHATRAEREQLGIEPGDAPGIHELPVVGKIGIAICYDIYFPELFAHYLASGVRCVFFPSLQRSESPEAVLQMLATRAMDCCAFFVRAAYAMATGGAWRPGLPYGMSCVVHPDGTVLANAGHYEGFAVASVHLAGPWCKPRSHGCAAASVRSFLLEDRRPVLYRTWETHHAD